MNIINHLGVIFSPLEGAPNVYTGVRVVFRPSPWTNDVPRKTTPARLGADSRHCRCEDAMYVYMCVRVIWTSFSVETWYREVPSTTLISHVTIRTQR